MNAIQKTLMGVGLGALLLAVGFLGGLGLVGRGLGDANRLAEKYRTDLVAERQRADELEKTVGDLEGRNRELTESLGRASDTLGGIDQAAGGIQVSQGDAIEKLRGVIAALEAIREKIRVYEDSRVDTGRGGWGIGS